MGEHCFAVSSGSMVPSAAEAKRRDRIARKVGGPACGYVRVRLPGEGLRAWGFGPNRGEPFDSAMAREIIAAWERAGLSAPAARAGEGR